jgi:CheY-like chemotaxis protein
MNLVINAFEAISTAAAPDRWGQAPAVPEASPTGEVTISVTRERVSRPVAGYETVEPGEYVVLRVRDTGIGIEEKDLDKLFQPFYTKKEMGRSGTGLGLTVVYGVVHDHRGAIDLQSKVDRGTEFCLYFPVTRESAPMADVRGECRGEEVVLVVDDLPEQRELASRLLSSLGYQVRTAENGRQAVAYLEENDVDIVVLDMIMEESFDGLETYRHIARMRPNQKVVIASGFSESDRVKEAQELGAGQFVRKPYTMDNIGRAIRHELDN